jgi:hypothetical protein
MYRISMNDTAYTWQYYPKCPDDLTMNTLWVFGDSYTAEYFPVGEEFTVSNYDHYKTFKKVLGYDR